MNVKAVLDQVAKRPAVDVAVSLRGISDQLHGRTDRDDPGEGISGLGRPALPGLTVVTEFGSVDAQKSDPCLLYTSPSPRD